VCTLTTDGKFHRTATQRHGCTKIIRTKLRVDQLAQLLPVGRTGHIARPHIGTALASSAD
jgi:hypothetical protein